MVVGDDVAVLAHDNARAAALSFARGRDNGYDRGADLFVDVLAGHAVRGARAAVRGLAVDLHGRGRAVVGRGRCGAVRLAAAGDEIGGYRAACEQKAGRGDAAQADDEPAAAFSAAVRHCALLILLMPCVAVRNAVLLLRCLLNRRLLGGLELLCVAALTRRQILRVLHRRLERGARLLAGLLLRLRRFGLLRRRFIRLLCLRLGGGSLGFRCLVFGSLVFVFQFIIEVVHWNGLLIVYCLYCKFAVWQFVENNVNIL